MREWAHIPSLPIRRASSSPMDMQTVFDAFELLDSWEERFDLVADLGRGLLPLEPNERVDGNLVPGCDTRTWLTGRPSPDGAGGMEYRADAEGPLVRGLVYLLLMPFQGRTPREILETDPEPYIARLGLRSALSAKRQVGMEAFLDRVKRIAAHGLSQG